MNASNRPKILIIDDTPENLFLLATALESEFDVQLASSGSEGIQLAKESPPDLVLLDVMMPEVDGYETFRRFRNQPNLVFTPIIFVTALADLDSELTGLALGAADYITKPIKVELVRHRVRNILRLTQTEQELKSSEERLRLIMNATGEGIWDWDVDQQTVVHNPTWCRLLGLDQTYLTHSMDTFIEHIHPDDVEAVRKAINESLVHGLPYLSEHRLRHEDGHYVWVSDRGDVVQRHADGTPSRMVGSIANIDERKKNEAEIHRLAFYDALTELANRRLFIDRLQHAIARSQRSKQWGGVMFLDMDRFKHLNDTHGHAMGDLLLVEVARRLRNSVRQEDTVARLGGDEFVVLLENLSPEYEAATANAMTVGQTVLRNLNQPYELNTLSYRSTPSIGLTVFSGNTEDVDSIIKRADHAMYAAKEAGRNTIRSYVSHAQSSQFETELQLPAEA